MTVDARVPFTAEAKLSDIHTTDSVPTNSLTKMGNCLTLGTLAAPFASTVTQLRPSLVSGVLQTPNTKPAHLYPVTLDGEYVDPLLKGIKKVLNTTTPLDVEMLEVAAKDAMNCHFAPDATRKILTFEEAIAGDSSENFITPINRKSSPGFPYATNNPSTGKRHWFGHDDYTYSEEIQEDVQELVDQASCGIRGDVVWTATLKDERRPIAKVDQGKTRVFTAGPMNYTIAFRMYFLAFINSVMNNRITNEVGVGTNVYNLDWHKTGLALSRHGKHVIAGDFSNFDGSLLPDVLWSILDLINEWYDDGPVNRRIRETLFEEICNARVLVKGELVQWDHSQPSGNPGTVIFNSLFNQIIMRMAYLQCKSNAGMPLVCDFKDHVSLQTFGDDNVLNISDEAIEWYNQITITESLAELGLTYTDEGKTGTIIKSRTLDDVAYLKRKFVRNQNGYFEAPLDPQVCDEMPNWIRGRSGKGAEATLENCEAALREIYFHGPQRYNDSKAALTTALRNAGISKRLPEFSEQRSIYESNYF
jgi:hypothetical protein